MTTIDLEFAIVESRLSETWEALAIQRTINELANKEVNPSLNSELNRYSGFWRTINMSLQATIFTGLFALLDENSSDSATFYSILRHAEGTNRHVALSGMASRLTEMRTKYKTYRHKLFGHNDKNREDWATRYNEAGFTWVSLEKDFEYLDHVFKVLMQLNKGDAVADEATSRGLQFPHNLSRRKVSQQTEELLRGLIVTSALDSASPASL